MRSAVRYLLLAIYALTIIVPLAWLLMSSLKDSNSIISSAWSPPDRLHFENFVNVWVTQGLQSGFVRSAIVTVATLLLLLPISAMAAYVLARCPFRGHKLVYLCFLLGMMFPQFLTIIPLYTLVKNLGMLFTLHGLIIVYVAYSLSFTIFVLTGFFRALPRELEEAAYLDGASDAQTFWRVMWPLARPGLLVAGVFNAIGLWNEYPLAFVLYRSAENKTLPIQIGDMALTHQYAAEWGSLFAGLVIVVLPVTVGYWFFRRRLSEAVLAGALKG